MNNLVTFSEKPAIRNDWDYARSVEMVGPVIGRWKKEARAMVIPELWNAHELLDGRGNNQYRIVKNFTFQNYCEAIGITRQTGRNWLIEAKLIETALVTKHTGNQENYTPRDVIDDVRKVMGGIDLDPASCPMAQETIEADRYFTEDDSGLSHAWSGRVFLNPPYQHPLIQEFTDKLVSELNNIHSAILLTNNNTDTRWFVKSANAASLVCLTTGRINFYTENIEKTMPTNGQAFFYFGDDSDAFAEVFKRRGLVVRVVND